MPRVLTHEDFVDLEKASTPAAAGLAEIVFDAVLPGLVWLVRHIVVQCTSNTKTTAWVYVGDALSQHLRDATTAGNLDVAEYPKELIVPGSRELRIRWTPPDNGSIAYAAIQFEVVSEETAPRDDPRLLTRAAASVGT